MAGFELELYRQETLKWLAGLRSGQGAYRLWSGGVPHLLPTAFAVFLLELFDALPVCGSAESTAIVEFLLGHRDPDTGLFTHGSSDTPGGRIHDSEYVGMQQTHFALQALKILGMDPLPALPFMDRWATRDGLEKTLAGLDWNNPWLVSNTVMFLYGFYRHEADRKGDAPVGTQWIRSWLEATQRPSGLWGNDAERRVYNAIYGAFHFLFFWLGEGLAVPRSGSLLELTKTLQTTEGYFAHTRGGGACEDYDCADLLLKLGAAGGKPVLDRHVARMLQDRNPDGGYCWAKKRPAGPVFLLGNWKPGLCLTENRRLLQQRLLDMLGFNRYWYYSGIRDLKCPTGASDIWSTWFRNLVLAEYDHEFVGSGAGWRFRTFPSMGWHPTKDTR